MREFPLSTAVLGGRTMGLATTKEAGMYLFTRRTRLAPEHAIDGMEWAATIAEKVNQITSLDVGVWTPMLSPGIATLSFGAAVESLTDLEDAQAKTMVDSMFLDLAKQGAQITVGGLDDQVAQFIVGGGEGPATPPSYVAVVESRITNGRFGSGVAAGAEIAQKATELGGIPTSFLLATTGTYGGVAWISAAATLKELEEGEAAVNANPDFVRLVDQRSENFVDGITTQSIWRRLV